MGAKSLYEMTCEEVVDLKIIEEARRRRTMEDERECKVPVWYPRTPTGLLVAINALSNTKARSRSVIMCCLAHHGADLLSNTTSVRDINRQYRDLLSTHGRLGGLSDLLEQTDIRHYSYASGRDGKGNFWAAARLVSDYAEYATGLGIGVPYLMAVCYAWSLTTSTDPNMAGIVAEMEPEVVFFRRYIEERAILMDAFWRIAQLRKGEQ